MELVYNTDSVQLFCGDARTMTLIPSGSVHFVCTSPPYYNARTEYASWTTYTEYLADMRRAWSECYRVLVDGGRIAVNVPFGYGRPSTGGYLPIADDTARGLVDAGFTLRGHIVWDKTPAGLGTAWGSWQSACNPSLRDVAEAVVVAHKGSAQRAPGTSTISRDDFLASTASVWRVAPARASWHPAPMPAELARRLIQLYTYQGDTVLDCFAGSCTVPFEAARAGRVGLGVEARADYLARATVQPLLQAA